MGTAHFLWKERTQGLRRGEVGQSATDASWPWMGHELTQKSGGMYTKIAAPFQENGTGVLGKKIPTLIFWGLCM